MGQQVRFALLVGARSNAGDHLIGDRVEGLLRSRYPDAEYIRLKRWLPMDDHLDALNSCDAIVLAGGPAFQPNVYPGIYPLVGDLDSIRAPLVAFGLGWKGYPGDERSVQSYRFTKSSQGFLDRLGKQPLPVSCRDHQTVRVLRAVGVQNAMMTGDPAWYDPVSLGRPFQAPEKISNIAFSTAANELYTAQSIKIIQGLTALFPEARIEAVFHHGWDPGDGLSGAHVRRFSRIRDSLSEHGIDCVSIAGRLDKMVEVYTHADLHVGYRLHAHLLKLSMRRPSFLLHEDGRGIGASAALNVPGVDAWERTTGADVLRGSQGLPLLHGALRRVVRKKATANPMAAAQLLDLIRTEISTNFIRLQHVGNLIDYHHDHVMRPFVDQISFNAPRGT